MMDYAKALEDLFDGELVTEWNLPKHAKAVRSALELAMKVESALKRGHEGSFSHSWDQDNAEAGFWLDYDDWTAINAMINPNPRTEAKDCGQDHNVDLYTLPPQSPDQGAVEALDLLQKRAYSHAEKSNSPKLMREWIDSDVEVIRQALTRPPLDLARLKRDVELMIARIGGGYDAIRGAKMALDHLAAIRPDLFGGKKI